MSYDQNIVDLTKEVIRHMNWELFIEFCRNDSNFFKMKAPTTDCPDYATDPNIVKDIPGEFPVATTGERIYSIPKQEFQNSHIQHPRKVLCESSPSGIQNNKRLEYSINRQMVSPSPTYFPYHGREITLVDSAPFVSEERYRSNTCTVFPNLRSENTALVCSNGITSNSSSSVPSRGLFSQHLASVPFLEDSIQSHEIRPRDPSSTSCYGIPPIYSSHCATRSVPSTSGVYREMCSNATPGSIRSGDYQSLYAACSNAEASAPSCKIRKTSDQSCSTLSDDQSSSIDSSDESCSTCSENPDSEPPSEIRCGVPTSTSFGIRSNHPRSSFCRIVSDDPAPSSETSSHQIDFARETSDDRHNKHDYALNSAKVSTEMILSSTDFSEKRNSVKIRKTTKRYFTEPPKKENEVQIGGKRYLSPQNQSLCTPVPPYRMHKGLRASTSFGIRSNDSTPSLREISSASALPCGMHSGRRGSKFFGIRSNEPKGVQESETSFDEDDSTRETSSDFSYNEHSRAEDSVRGSRGMTLACSMSISKKGNCVKIRKTTKRHFTRLPKKECKVQPGDESYLSPKVILALRWFNYKLVRCKCGDPAEKGRMVKCNFCSTLQHFKCARNIFENGSMYMCYNCIRLGKRFE